MGAHKLALRDVDLALSSGYPEDKAFKLYERAGECQSASGSKSQALDSFQMAIKMIKKNSKKIKVEQQKKFIAALEQKIEKVKGEMEQSLSGCKSDNHIKVEENSLGFPNGIDLNPDR